MFATFRRDIDSTLHKLMKLSLLISLTLFGTSLAMIRRGVKWQDLSLVQMSGDGFTQYINGINFLDKSSLGMIDFLGYPRGLSTFAIPGNDHIYNFLVFLNSQLIGDGIAGVNLTFFLGFGLALTSSYWVLRQNGAGIPIAIILSTNFAFIPEHWHRQSHTSLSLYWVIPLMIHFAIKVANEQHSWNIENKLIKFIGIPIILCFFALQGVYYSLFFLFLLLVAISIRFISKRKYSYSERFSVAIVAIYIFFFGSSIYLSSRIAEFSGTNLSIFKRSPVESLIYGGEVAPLIIPWSGSEIPIINRYAPYMSFALGAGNEKYFWQSLIGAVCVFVCIFTLFIFPVSSSERLSKYFADIEVRILTVFFVVTFFIYIQGGLGFILSFVNPQIRAWNRISFFIVFIAMLLVIKIWDQLKKQNDLHRRKMKTIVKTLNNILIFLIISILSLITYKDVLPSGLRLDLTESRNFNREWELFSKGIYSFTERGCPVVQYPIAAFPEIPPIEKMADYDQMIPALFLPDLRFTYGNIKGSINSSWMANLPVKFSNKSTYEKLAANGFCGVLFDTVGLNKKQSRDLEIYLVSNNSRTLQSVSKRWIYMDLKSIGQTLTIEKMRMYRQNLLEGIYKSIDQGFSSTETENQGNFNWAVSKNSKIKILNMGLQSVTRQICLNIEPSPFQTEREISLSGGPEIVKVRLEDQNVRACINLKLTSGKTETIDIRASGVPDKVEGDPRKFLFKLRNIDIELPFALNS